MSPSRAGKFYKPGNMLKKKDLEYECAVKLTDLGNTSLLFDLNYK